MKTTDTEDGSQTLTAVRKLVNDALEYVRLSSRHVRGDLFGLGCRLSTFEIDFHTASPGEDAFVTLEARAKEDPTLPDYTARYLRSIAALGVLCRDLLRVVLGDWVPASGQDAEVAAKVAELLPKVTMAHYLATNKVRDRKHDSEKNEYRPRELTAEKKLELLRLAEQSHWKVGRLTERINCELGIDSDRKADELDEVIGKTAKGMKKLTKLVEGNHSLKANQLTDIWHLNALIARYCAAIAKAVPEGMRGSVPTPTFNAA